MASSRPWRSGGGRAAGRTAGGAARVHAAPAGRLRRGGQRTVAGTEEAFAALPQAVAVARGRLPLAAPAAAPGSAATLGQAPGSRLGLPHGRVRRVLRLLQPLLHRRAARKISLKISFHALKAAAVVRADQGADGLALRRLGGLARVDALLLPEVVELCAAVTAEQPPSAPIDPLPVRGSPCAPAPWWYVLVGGLAFPAAMMLFTTETRPSRPPASARWPLSNLAPVGDVLAVVGTQLSTWPVCPR